MSDAIQSNPDIGSLAVDLAKAQAELTNPHKNREVTVQPREGRAYHFSYATLDSILDGVRPILARHRLSIVQLLIAGDKGPVMRTMLLHASGQSISTDVPVIVDRPGNQALGSGMSYARRYGLIALLALAADSDDDGNEADGNTVKDIRDRRPAASAAQPVAGTGTQPRNAPAEPPHVVKAKALMTGPKADALRGIHRRIGLADWKAVAALAGDMLADYEAAVNDLLRQPEGSKP